MLIGIDGNEANVRHRVGVGQYAFEIIKHLILSDQENKYYLYLKEKPLSDFPQENENVSYKIFGPKKFWTQFAAPIRLKFEKTKPVVFFTPSHYAPRFCPIPSVISIMDMSFLSFPQMFKKKDLAQLKSWTAYSVKQAEKIITISNFSKNQILDFYQIPQDKVVVTYLGVDTSRFKENIRFETEKIEETKKKYHLPKDYLIFIGTLQPKKNLVRLIQALSILKQTNSGITLVISGMINVGRGGWMYKEIFDKVNELKLVDNVIFTNYVSDEDIPYLLAGARIYTLPSLSEGFGIPVLEAMAAGVPVVVSNVSSLPEIVEDAGIFIDPYNIESIAEGINKAINLTDGQRMTLIEKGFTRAKKFSWNTCAQKTLVVLKEVGSKYV